MKQAAVSYHEWMEGDAVAVGRALMEHLPAAQQVARGLAVLNICRSRWAPIPAVEHVATLAADPMRWREAHDAFTAVRHLTLREEREPTNPRYEALLFVAEIVAKIIYNASGEPAPFDHNSTWWLPRNARDFVRASGDEAVAHEVWRALTARER